MLRGLTLPDSWRSLLEAFRPVFHRSSTFTLFLLLATGLVAQTTRRTVVGMLAGAGMATVVSFHSVCRFFSQHAWSVDRLGLLLARLIVTRLLEADAPILVAFDDTLFRRWGRKVHHAFWTHDGAAQGPAKLGRGNRWVIAGIVVELPFCGHPVCLPVLFRLWGGKGSATPVQLASELLKLLAEEFPGRATHGVGDAAYHGKLLVVADTTWTTRLPSNAALFGPKPPRTGKRGRPRLKGQRLGRPTELTTSARWQRLRVSRYGRRDIILVAVIETIWYGAFGNTPGRTVLVRDTGTDSGYDLAIFTTDLDSGVADIVARYAARWPIETAIAASKQLLGIGQTRNRLQRAVERTVPFSFCVYSLVIVWYATVGYHPDDITSRLAAQPWYGHKTEPAFEDMVAKLRRSLIAARITGVGAAQPDPDKYRDFALACAATAA
ncbi:MAG: transposase [Actinophytocola sp.]|nr:transposase [Actinophytocola sp.]